MNNYIKLFVLSLPLLVAPLDSFAKDEKPVATKPAGNEDTFELLNLFGDVFERVKADYVEEVTDKQLVESALNGMLTALDPHSGYLNQKSFEDMQVQTKGEFGGLGIEVTMENGLVKVVSPIDDTPAYKAGVHAGDYISMIDGEQVMGLSLQDAVEKLRGLVNTSVKITVIREGAPEPIEFKITRAVIKIQSVKYRTEGDVGYIRITSFNENTYSGLQKAVEDLKTQIGDKMKGVVLDLRNNPGGLLDQAIAVSDAFLEQGEVVSTRGRTADSIKRFNAHEGDLINGLPIVILINSGSASASEIVSGALQDHKRAVIMGVKSFGKGSVQTVIPIPDHGAIRLTTARYYTPSGNSIQAKGITPDIAVEQAKIEPVKQSPFERHEAELRGRLENDQDKNKKDKDSKDSSEKDKNDKKDDKDAKPSADDNSDNSKPDDADNTSDNGKDSKDPKEASKKPGRPGEIGADKDFQLARALDLIRGLALVNGTKGAAKDPLLNKDPAKDKAPEKAQ